jgi:hypothetical protein
MPPRELFNEQTPDEKQTDIQDALASKWYAARETGQFFWNGPDRATYKEAKADADKHDKAKHDGEETAVVLSGTYSRPSRED